MIFGLGAIAGGVVMIAARRSFTRTTNEFQRAAFGFKFGKREERINQAGALIVGSAFIAFGVALLVVSFL